MPILYRVRSNIGSPFRAGLQSLPFSSSRHSKEDYTLSARAPPREVLRPCMIAAEPDQGYYGSKSKSSMRFTLRTKKHYDLFCMFFVVDPVSLIEGFSSQ